MSRKDIKHSYILSTIIVLLGEPCYHALTVLEHDLCFRTGSWGEKQMCPDGLSMSIYYLARGVPHSVQNLPLFFAPQAEQNQVSRLSTATGATLFTGAA